MGSRDDDIAHLVSVAAELCDAHLDTLYLVRDEDLGLDWASHVEYLQRLRRMTEQALANAASDASFGSVTEQ
jgi:hypothetical protein